MTIRSITGKIASVTVSICDVFPPVEMATKAIDIGTGWKSSYRGCAQRFSETAPLTSSEWGILYLLAESSKI